MVTGGGSGMGRAICHHLARQGRQVAVLDIDGDAADEVAKEVQAEGGTAVGAGVDVSDRAAIDAALGEVRAALGPIGIMVTSAGIEGFEDFLDIDTDAWDRMIAVNLTGTFHCLQAAVPDMIEKVMPSLSKSAIDFHSGLIFGFPLLNTNEIWYCHGAIE